MRTIHQGAIALACAITMSTYVGAQDRLSDAKGLYDSASYSEALSALSQVTGEGDLVEVEKYRALCLLALGRPKDAELSLEHLAMTRPLFTLDGSDASPKLVALFQDVRKRTLPEASKQTYQRGRASFEKNDMADASRQFKDVLAMAQDAPPESAALMNDLKMLATGFLKLSEAALAQKPEVRPATSATPSPVAPASPTTAVPTDATKPNPPAATPPVTAAPRTAAAAVAARAQNSQSVDPIYDASDITVKMPVAIDRQVPKWERPRALNFRAFEGLLEIVVAEDGTVLEAKMVKVMNPGYDYLLVTAAHQWRFQPATLEGRPVKYRMTYSFVVPPVGR